MLSVFSCRRVDEHAALAATRLSFDPVETLGPDQHLALLRWLADALLETQKVSAALQSEHRDGRVRATGCRACNLMRAHCFPSWGGKG